MQASYPITIDVTSPTEVARWRPLINWLLIVPHQIYLYILNIGVMVVTLLSWFVIVFTGRQPENWGAFTVGVLRYQWRVVCYEFAWTEDYPAFGAQSGYADPGDFPAALGMTPPDSERNRLTVFFRGLMTLPQYLALFVVGIAAGLALLIAWFSVLFTGRWPEGLRTFCVGYFRWALRVQAFYFLLTDVYPPFGVSA